MKRTVYKMLLIVIFLLAGSLVMKDDTVFLEKKTELVIREIGHHLLLKSEDSLSRILPVKKLPGNTFRLEFQNKLAFVPDTLAKIVHQRLSVAGLPLDYRVSVMQC